MHFFSIGSSDFKFTPMNAFNPYARRVFLIPFF